MNIVETSERHLRTDAELRRSIENYRIRLAEERQRSEQTVAEEKQYQERYRDVQTRVIEPVFQQFQQVIAECGEHSEILTEDAHFPEGLVLVLYPSAKPRESYTEKNTPKIRFLPIDDYSRIVAQMVVDDLLVYGRHLGEWPTEKIRPEDVESVLFQFVTEVFKIDPSRVPGLAVAAPVLTLDNRLAGVLKNSEAAGN